MSVQREKKDDNPIEIVEPNFIGCTASHIAAIKKNAEVVEILLSGGADFTIQNAKGHTVLHSVFYQTNPNQELINTILTLHLSLNDPSDPCDEDGVSHFHIACMYDREDVAKFFLNNGIPIDKAVNTDSKRFAGYSPLHFAAEGIALSVIKMLLKQNANMDNKEARGLTAFHLLLEKKISLFNFYNKNDDQIPSERISAIDDVLNTLLNSNEVDDIGFTHFHFACTQVDRSISEYFLEQDIDIDQQVKMDSPIFPGYTALHFAAHCNIKIAKMLLNKKANYEANDAKGLTPMDLFWQMCKPEDLQLILTQNWKYMTFLDKQTRPIDIVKVAWEPELLETYLIKIMDIKTKIGDVPARWTGRTILHFAVMRCKSIESMKVCMSGGLDVLVSVQDSYNISPIHLAFRMGKYEDVKVLLHHYQHFANIADNDGLSFMHIACALGKHISVKQVCHDKNINEPYHGTTSFGLVTPGSTALHVAMACGYCTIIEMLLHRKLDLEAKDASGQTPLDLFFKHTDKFESVCRTLLSSLALTEDKLEKFGVTKLHMAIYCREMDIRKFVTQNNINAVIKCEDKSSVFYSYNGLNSLQIATKMYSQIKVIKILLEEGANLPAEVSQSDTMLYEAMSDNINWNAMVLTVVRFHKDENLLKKIEEISGITILHVASLLLKRDAVSWLPITRFDVNAKVKSDCPVWPGCTPLHVLLKTIEYNGITDKFEEILKLLLSAGADVTIPDDNGVTPIHLASRYIYTRRGKNMLNLLLKHIEVFIINPVDQNGMSHFHTVCLMNRVKKVKLFLENGINANQLIDCEPKDMMDESSLYWVFNDETKTFFNSKCKQGTIDWLLSLGVIVMKENDRNEMPLNPALNLKCQSVILENILGNCEEAIQIPRTLGEMRTNLDDFNAGEGTTREGTIYDTRRITIYRTMKEFQFKFFNRDELIERYPLTEDNIDFQDEKGKTSLHLAAQLGNFTAIDMLLKNGADINILDKAKKTAFKYATHHYNDKIVTYATSVSERTKCIACFAGHVSKLKDFRLRIKLYNLEERNRALSDVITKNSIVYRKFYNKAKISKAMREIKTLVIVDNEPKLVLNDFLSETGRGLVSYPFMSDFRRQKVDRFFRCYDGVLKDVCLLQYRKALKRVNLVKLASGCVWTVTGVNVPIVCIDIIFQYLGNSDLEKLIKAGNCED